MRLHARIDSSVHSWPHNLHQSKTYRIIFLTEGIRTPNRICYSAIDPSRRLSPSVKCTSESVDFVSSPTIHHTSGFFGLREVSICVIAV